MRYRDQNPPHALDTGEPFPLYPLSSTELEAAGAGVPMHPQVLAVEESQLQDTCIWPCAREDPRAHLVQNTYGTRVICQWVWAAGRAVPLVPSPPVSSQKVSFPLSTFEVLAPGSQARVSHGPVWKRNSTQYSLITYRGKEPEE